MLNSRAGQGKGFTLIELLIVIAIIAILALIAVPNFLEAQVRAKVSRARADMRSMAAALESYAVDYSQFPRSVCPSSDTARFPKAKEITWSWYARLTTPLAYITTIPVDPFGDIDPDGWGESDDQLPYHFYSGNTRGYKDPTPEEYVRAPRNVYVLISQGPNRILDVKVDITHYDAYLLYDYTYLNPGGKSWNGLVYDPSNGTVSYGDIYKFNSGGTMPLFKE